MDSFLGEIRLFAGPFAPANWAYCDGTLLAIQQYSALYSIIGSVYGGNGVTNFALPNLMGMVAVGAGAGPGMTPRKNGDTGGATTHTLTVAEMAAHSHPVPAFTATGDLGVATGNYFASAEFNRQARTSTDTCYTQAAADSTMNAAMLAPFVSAAPGSVQPHANIMPYLGLGYIISLSGAFPPRS